MTADARPNHDTNPTEMAFQILKNGLAGGAARLGKLSLPKRRAMDTPNFIALTSRGTVPHITPDNITQYTAVAGGYMALEDCENLALTFERARH